MIGYGTFGGADAPELVYKAAKVALEVGYRHFDTAYLCKLFFTKGPLEHVLTRGCLDQTEKQLGQAIRESNVPREELFVTTKLWQTFHEPQHVRPACERSLKELGFDYLDMYMLHWPMAWKFHGYEHDKLQVRDKNGHIGCIDVPIIDTWRAMEQLVKDGLVRSIGNVSTYIFSGDVSLTDKLIYLGVSNFTIPMLEELLKQAEIPPAMNQVINKSETHKKDAEFLPVLCMKDRNSSQLASRGNARVGQGTQYCIDRLLSTW